MLMKLIYLNVIATFYNFTNYKKFYYFIFNTKIEFLTSNKKITIVTNRTRPQEQFIEYCSIILLVLQFVLPC